MSGADLKSKTIYGMIWAASQRFGTMILSFVSNLILARLLTPDDFGAIGMIAIFIALSNNFIDGGFGASLIQKTDTTENEYSTIFFWNLFLSIIIYFIIWLSSPCIASFFEIAILCDLLRCQSIVLIVNALGLVQRIRLRKQLLFKKLAIVDLASSIFAVCSAIFAAYSGFGVWSLILYQIVFSCCQTLGLWISHKWCPIFIFDFQSFKSLFKYGGYLLISDMLNTLCDNLQGLLIGKRFSPAVMGYYSQAKKLEEVPTNSISNIVAQVTFPVFSQLKGNIDALKTAHQKCIHATNFINIPLMSLLIVIAHPLILFLFTDKWVDSISYFRILCIAGLANCLQSINYQLYVAMGYSKAMFKWNIIKRGIGIGLIIIGAVFGVKGILWGMVISFWITYFINARLAGRVTGYFLSRQLIEIVPILLITIVSCVSSFFLGYVITYHYAIIMMVQVVIFLVTYLFLSYIFKIPALRIYTQILSETMISIRNRISKNNK